MAFFILLVFPKSVLAATGDGNTEMPKYEFWVTEEEIDWGAMLDDFDSAEIQDFLNVLGDEAASAVSFREMMEMLIAGNLMEVFEQGAGMIKSAWFAELRTNGSLVRQIVVLSVIGAVFSGFAGVFGSTYISETGFYVVYLLSMTFFAAGFLSSVAIAANVLEDILGFMRVLLPAYFMAVAMAGSALTSAAVCGFTIGVIGMVQAVFGQVLIPLMRVYMMFVLVGNLYKEEMLSRLTELLGTAVLWSCKCMFGGVVGFHIIQGLVLPQADALKNASAMRLVQMVPGIGGGAGAISQMVLGSGILIKNTVGAAALIILVFIAVVPMMKLALLMVLYYLASAAMQPVCDKRLVACMNGIAVSHGILLKVVGYSLALFAAAIAVICVSTNAAWYAG